MRAGALDVFAAVRRAAWLRSAIRVLVRRQPARGRGEPISALDVGRELIPARAARREQHDARTGGKRERGPHGVFDGPDGRDGEPTREHRLDLGARLTQGDDGD